MAMYRKYSDEIVNAMLEGWRGGMSYEEVGKQFNIGKGAIGSIIRRYRTEDDAKKFKESRTPAPEAVEETMIAWRAGHTYDEIAEKIGCTRGEVGGIINRHKDKDERGSKIRHVEYNSFHEKFTTTPGPMDLEIGNAPAPSRIFTGIHFPKCQWIAGEVGPDDHCKCGKKTGAGRVYCPTHETKAVRVNQNEQ